MLHETQLDIYAEVRTDRTYMDIKVKLDKNLNFGCDQILNKNKRAYINKKKMYTLYNYEKYILFMNKV